MKKPTLLVMAAGLGSRYGSLKQMDPFGPSGETIIDYSVYDARRAGFGKVVFVVREAILEDFKQTILSRFTDRIEVDSVLQVVDQVPDGVAVPAERVKPWGTGHAVLVAAAKVHEPFAVINADDYYGAKSFQLMGDYLTDLAVDAHEYCLLGYRLENTLSEHGHVSRGVCQIDAEGYLQQVTERTRIYRTDGGNIVYEENGQTVPLTAEETVSMNLMGFAPSAFAYFEAYFKDFIRERGQELKSEFYLPFVMNEVIQRQIAKVKVITTPDRWFGVTYQADKAVAQQRFKELVQQGVYPERLWGES
ncbi:MAG: nucleotidyltransferase [Tunicatimonas sp.]